MYDDFFCMQRFSTIIVDSANDVEAQRVMNTGTGKSNLVGSILLTVMSLLFGNWFGLVCAIPAVLYAIKVSTDTL